jgi:hypothetical protein
MAAGSKEGPQAVVRAFVQIMKDHLPARIVAILAERGFGSQSAPPDPEGYATSRVVAENTLNAVTCHVDGERMIQEFHAINSPRRLESLVTVKIQYGDIVNDLEVEDPLNVLTAAIRYCVDAYWRAYAATTCLSKVEYISSQAASSLREQFRYEGWQNYGRAVENTNEQNEINFECEQFVESEVFYTP